MKTTGFPCKEQLSFSRWTTDRRHNQDFVFCLRFTHQTVALKDLKNSSSVSVLMSLRHRPIWAYNEERNCCSVCRGRGINRQKLVTHTTLVAHQSKQDLKRFIRLFWGEMGGSRFVFPLPQLCSSEQLLQKSEMQNKELQSEYKQGITAVVLKTIGNKTRRKQFRISAV